MTEPRHRNQQPGVRRSRLVVVTLVVVLLGAVCAVIPPVAPLGFLLCGLAIVPAVVGYVRVRRRGAPHPGQALGALILAPTFFLVSVVVVGLTATPTPAPVGHTSALAAPAPTTFPSSRALRARGTGPDGRGATCCNASSGPARALCWPITARRGAC